MSKRAKEAALKAYPPKRKEVSMTGAIYTVVGGDFERRIFQEGYEAAKKDILDLLEDNIVLHLGHATVDNDTTATDGLIEAKELILTQL